VETCSALPEITLKFFESENDTSLIESATKSVKLENDQLKYACMTHYRRLNYNDGGKGNITRNYSVFWPDVDMWELIEQTVILPDNAIYMKIPLEAVPVEGIENILEAYLFYRPEYKLH